MDKEFKDSLKVFEDNGEVVIKIENIPTKQDDFDLLVKQLARGFSPEGDFDPRPTDMRGVMEMLEDEEITEEITPRKSDVSDPEYLRKLLGFTD